jgi:hypothetical protein
MASQKFAVIWYTFLSFWVNLFFNWKVVFLKFRAILQKLKCLMATDGSREREKMKKPSLTRKNLSSAITLLLTLTIAASFIAALPDTYGQSLVQVSMTAILYKTPNPVGVNQKMFIEGLVSPTPGIVNLTFNITKPDKTVETLIKTTDATAEAQFEYTPNQIGSWSIKLFWAGDATHSNATATTTFTVQTEAVPPITKITVFTYVSATPKIVGIGEKVLLNGMVTPPREYNAIYKDLIFTITKPSGTVVTHKQNTESAGTVVYMFTCDELGNYTVKLSFPGDYLHPAIDSPITKWTVATTGTPRYQNEPLPTGQWTYPISTEYWEWYQIAGSWPQPWYDAAGTSFNPNSLAPNAPHILWKTPLSLSGMVGENGWQGLTGTEGYKGQGTSRRMMNMIAGMGRLYYVIPEYIEYNLTTAALVATPVVHCIDQTTGKELYKSVLPINPLYPFTQDAILGSGSICLEILPEAKVDPITGVSQKSAISLWVTGGGIWEVDAFSGSCLYYLGGNFDARLFSQAGVQYDQGSLYLTNYPMSGNLTRFDTRSKTVVWTKQISDPTNIGGGMLATLGSTSRTWNATTGESICNSTALDVYSPQRVTTLVNGMTVVGLADMTFRGVNLTTGKEMWKSPNMDPPWGVFTSYVSASAYGNYYQGGMDGNVYCVNLTTGQFVWKFYCGDSTETATGTLSPQGQPIIADGKVYITAGARSPPYPTPRGVKLFCLNAFNGSLIWEYDGIFTQQASGGISSGNLFIGNMYDGCVYNFGKGPSAMTVSASPKVIASGSSVLIEGTVTDQSPGATGTPAVSDASMSSWMQYLYNNKPMPTNATGVTVLLQAKYSNGTLIDISHVTSDSMGHYEYAWTPPTQDTYKIIATFEGSESYWSSTEQTGLAVTKAVSPVVTPTPTATVAPTASPIVTPTVAPTPSPTTPQGPGALPFSTVYAVSAAVVIIAVVAVTALVLRRRK